MSTRCALLLASILCLPIGASAIGVMQSAVEGQLRGQMELTSVDVQVSIRDRLAITRVDQVFTNPSDIQVEGIYTFQLPESAIITDLVLWIGDRRVQGQIMEAVTARETYDEIVGRRIDPALIERVSDQLFRLSVFPFPAEGSRRVELEYMEVLEAEEGITSYVFPLAAEVMEAEVGLFQFEAQLHSQIAFDVAVAEAYGAAASVEQTDDHSAAVSYIEEEWSPSADLRVVVAEREILQSPRLMSYPPTDDAMGYYVMWLPPVHELLEAAPLPRRVTFVIDKSGSMRVTRLPPLKNALAEVIETLDPDDLFNIVVFNSNAQSFSSELLPANPEEIDAAARFVRQLEAGGGTNFGPALQVAYSGLDPAEPHSVVFLTMRRAELFQNSFVCTERRVVGRQLVRSTSKRNVSPGPRRPSPLPATPSPSSTILRSISISPSMCGGAPEITIPSRWSCKVKLSFRSWIELFGDGFKTMPYHCGFAGSGLSAAKLTRNFTSRLPSI